MKIHKTLFGIELKLEPISKLASKVGKLHA